MAEAVLLVGTKKGLWIGRSDERPGDHGPGQSRSS